MKIGNDVKYNLRFSPPWGFRGWKWPNLDNNVGKALVILAVIILGEKNLKSGNFHRLKVINSKQCIIEQDRSSSKQYNVFFL